MTKPQIIQIGSDQTWLVKGDLTIEWIVDTLQLGLNLIKIGKAKIEFDFSEVNSVDSSAVAMLISWLKKAQLDGKELLFYALPRPMLNIMALSNLTQLFDLGLESGRFKIKN